MLKIPRKRAISRRKSAQLQNAPARESTSNYFATEEPLLARRAGIARKATGVARLGVRPFGNFERHELDPLATPTATNAMRQMGPQYQPDAPVLKLRYFFCIFPGEIDILKILAMCKTSPGVSPC
jgi:hypothetical protein